MQHRKTILAASITLAFALVGPGAVQAHAATAPQTQDAPHTTDQGKKTPKSRKAKPQETNIDATDLKGVSVSVGIRGSEQQDITNKRFAPQILDSITAVDIGQLPDATITDSLQRVPGVQIDRSAGEGSTLNVRGLPQVVSMLNGEVFLSADNIVSQQPDFSDIPSQLFAGVDVVKTPTASLLNNGITGTVNLKTRHPLDMKKGWTVAASGDLTHGFKVNQTQPEGNFLFNYNDGGRWGGLMSVAFSDVTHENSTFGLNQYNGILVGENAASTTTGVGFLGAFGGAPIPSDIRQLGGGNVDVNGDGKHNAAFYSSQSLGATQDQIQRNRLGINASIQGKLGSAFKLTGDFFYTHQHQYDRGIGWAADSVTWNGATWVPTQFHNTGVTVTGPTGAGSWGQDQTLYTVQGYRKWPGVIDPNSHNTETKSISRNTSIRLDYDNGGIFTGDVRWINGHAHQTILHTSVEYTDADGTAWPNSPSDAAPPGIYIFPDGNRPFNAGGIAPNTMPMDILFSGSHMSVNLPPELADTLADPARTVLKTVAMENNYDRQSNLNVLRADGHLHFDDTANLRLDLGVRNSIRTASDTLFNMIAPVWAGQGASDPKGCYVHWKAADVVLDGGGIAGACTAGNSQGFFRANPYAGLNVNQLPAIMRDNTHLYKGVAGVKGIAFWAIDPRAMDKQLAFQEALYPGEIRDSDPGSTWNLKLRETTGYLAASFDDEELAVPISGNVGIRVVRTHLLVNQSTVGAARPYGLTSRNAGISPTRRVYTDYLPAANLAFNITDSFKIRAAFSKNMMPLNLDEWGGGLTLDYSLDTTTVPGKSIFAIDGGYSPGNPGLDPWRSKNYDLSFEYYGAHTMASLAVFFIKVQSFIQNGTITRCDLPDQDGVVRNRCIPISEPVQGKGANLKGAEVDLKQNFRFLPGFWGNFGIDVNATFSPSNTGKDLAGNTVPFQDNSKYQENLAIWYQSRRFQFRVAANHRSKRAVSADVGGIEGMEMYQKPTTYLDASVSYQVNPNLVVFLQGSNLTGEGEKYYLVWPDEMDTVHRFERRVLLGARVKF